MKNWTNQTFKQLAERAARRAEYEECQDLNNPGWREIHKYNKKKQKKNKAASSKPQASSCKLDSDRRIM